MKLRGIKRQTIQFLEYMYMQTEYQHKLSIKAFVNSTNPKEATVFCQFFRVLTNIDIPVKEVLLKTIQGITSKLFPLTRDLFFTQRNAHAVTKTDL